MRIGIDGSFLSGQLRGHSLYSVELCRALDKLLPAAEFYVYSPVAMQLPVQSQRWHLRTGYKPLAFSPIAWLKLVAGRLIHKDKLDIFWGPYYFLPYLPDTVRLISTVHDFAYQVTPGTLPASHAAAFHLFLHADIRRADAIISPSQGTADRIASITGSPATTVINPAVSDAYCPPSAAQVEACRQHFKLGNPFLLNVATWEPRKNVDLLASTFLQLKNQGQLKEHELVLVGKKGWRFEALESLVNQNDSIRWLDYVPADFLPALYAAADLFVFPSLYEGFGMPVLEARACGTRAVATDSAELREAGGQDTIYVQLNEASLGQGILDGLRRIDDPLNTPALPDWEAQARLLKQVFVDLLNR